MPVQKFDRRQEKTRRALLQAFREFIQQGRFDDVGVAEIAARARVSRSTFYEHFAGKNGLLAASIAAPFARLTATLAEVDNTPDLQALLEHFWGNRRLARELFSGSARRKVLAVLVDQIARELRSGGHAKRGRLILPLRLAAVQLSEVLLAPVIAWLAGESRCATPILARALRQVARGTLASMRS